MNISIPGTESACRALMIFVGLGSSACADHVGRAELLRQIEAGEAPPIVDVRSRGEFETSHVPGAVHVPFYSLLSQGDRIPEGQPIVVYCEHGPRAGIARAQLWLTIDRPVLFLEGHMTAWKRDGLPVDSEEPD
jgi:rhodanese-related sulfurtransferase